MQTLLESLTGTVIRLDQTGDVGVTGRLVNVQEDYASVLTDKQQVIHYPYKQLKSVSTTVMETPRIVPVPDVSFPPSFLDLLDTLLFQLVQIENGDGARQGVLSSYNDGEICIIVKTKELVFYPIGQIKNIAPIYRIQGQEESDDDPAGSDSSSSRSGGSNGGSDPSGGSGNNGNKNNQGDKNSNNSKDGEKDSGNSNSKSNSASDSGKYDYSGNSQTASYQESSRIDKRQETQSSSQKYDSDSECGSIDKGRARRMLDNLLAEEERERIESTQTAVQYATGAVSQSSPSFVNKRCRVKRSHGR